MEGPPVFEPMRQGHGRRATVAPINSGSTRRRRHRWATAVRECRGDRRTDGVAGLPAAGEIREEIIYGPGVRVWLLQHGKVGRVLEPHRSYDARNVARKTLGNGGSEVGVFAPPQDQRGMVESPHSVQRSQSFTVVLAVQLPAQEAAQSQPA